MTFAVAFQKHLDSYVRPDKEVNSARAFIVDPGYSRTPGTRRWLSGGSLLGLMTYLITWPFWWLILKSPDQAAQSFLKAAMEAEYAAVPGGKMIKECMEMQALRQEVKNGDIAKELWEFSEKQVERLEKAGAVKRALAKKEAEMEEKTNGTVKKDEAAASGTEKTTTPGSRRSKKKT